MKNFFIKKILFLNIISLVLPSLLLSMEKEQRKTKQFKKQKHQNNPRPVSWPSGQKDILEDMRAQIRVLKGNDHKTCNLFLKVCDDNRGMRHQFEQLVALVAIQQGQIAKLLEQTQAIHSNAHKKKSNHKNDKTKKKTKSLKRPKNIRRKKTNELYDTTFDEIADLKQLLNRSNGSKKTGYPQSSDTVVITSLDENDPCLSNSSTIIPEQTNSLDMPLSFEQEKRNPEKLGDSLFILNALRKSAI